MPHHPPNADLLALNAAWKRQQQAKLTTTQQKPAIEPRIEAVEPDKPAVIHPATPKPAAEKPKIQNQQPPAECENCQVRPACKAVLKLWHKHAPRNELARSWCKLIDEHAKDMVCLSGLRELAGAKDNRFSLRELK